MEEIDVSGCEFYGDDNGIGRCFCTRNDGWDVDLITNYSCADNPNCHYKQLKRKEKDYDKLLLAYHAVDDRRRNLEEQLKRKEKECEELKNCDKTLIYKQARNNFEKLNKLKQALQEIKEICEENYYQDTWARLALKLDDILQKISEVEE